MSQAQTIVINEKKPKPMHMKWKRKVNELAAPGKTFFFFLLSKNVKKSSSAARKLLRTSLKPVCRLCLLAAPYWLLASVSTILRPEMNEFLVRVHFLLPT